jgi:riboflavin biosynthesis pyrimidine reductase
MELPVPSIDGAQRREFLDLGLTDAVILHVCSMVPGGVAPTLVTADSKLANAANALGYSVIDYRQEFLNG